MKSKTKCSAGPDGGQSEFSALALAIPAHLDLFGESNPLCHNYILLYPSS